MEIEEAQLFEEEEEEEERGEPESSSTYMYFNVKSNVYKFYDEN